MLKDFFGDPLPKQDKKILEYENILNHTPGESSFDLILERKQIEFKKKKELIIEVVQKPNRNKNGRNRK